MKNRYTIKEIEETTTFVYNSHNEFDDYKTEYDESLPVGADLSEVLAAIENGCWDNIDERDDEVIFYPADKSMNFKTGAYESTTVVVSGKPAHIRWLMYMYHLRRVKRVRGAI